MVSSLKRFTVSLEHLTLPNKFAQSGYRMPTLEDDSSSKWRTRIPSIFSPLEILLTSTVLIQDVPEEHYEEDDVSPYDEVDDHPTDLSSTPTPATYKPRYDLDLQGTKEIKCKN